jgi:uncharacterized protein (TIGR00255 family)
MSFPIRSMTGCGEGSASDGGTTCRVELRSVNNRFFKFSLRCADGVAALEPRIEAVVRERVRRGSVQATLALSGPSAPAARRLDASQLGTYLDALADFCAARGLPAPTSVDPLLSLPGVFAEAPPDPAMAERLWPLVAGGLAAALDAFDAMRAAEAAALAADLRGVCGEVRTLVTGIANRLPQVLEEHRTRLVERVGKLLEPQGVPLAPADVAREVALVADRSDIAEELVRLRSHLDQFERLLAEPASGRALDFLTQELGREANTIGSKSADVAIAHAVVEIKARLERLREQVQNLE